MIVKYFKRGKSHTRKGVMVAVPADGVVTFGYSLCHTKLDKFDKEFGKNIAIRRAATALAGRVLNIPDSMKKEFEQFKLRCKKYYKQLTVEL